MSSILGILSIPALLGAAFWYDFTAWKATGTGGTPPTLQGYIKIRRWGLWLLFHPQNLLDYKAIPDAGPAYVDPEKFSPRAPPRPSLTRWTLPQRQHPVPITAKAKQVLEGLIQSFASSSPYTKYITTRPSKTEGGTGPALYVNQDVTTINPNAHKIFYEIAHLHPSDLSLHVYLAPKDARLVVEKGWGHRFPVSWLAPPSWVMLYAPRDEQEVEAIRIIVEAGISFAIGKDIRLEK